MDEARLTRQGGSPDASTTGHLVPSLTATRVGVLTTFTPPRATQSTSGGASPQAELWKKGPNDKSGKHGAIQGHRCRWRSGRPFRGLPLVATRDLAACHSRREHADWRRVAEALGLATPVLASRLPRAPRHAV